MWLQSLLVASGLAACGALPASEAPSKAPVTMLRVEGARGSASPERAASQVGAEGRAALARHHLEVLAGLDGGTLYRGNEATLLVDGPATFAAMSRAIAAARRRVVLQSYIVEDEGVAKRIGDLLLERAAAGVRVQLLYDAVGSLTTPEAYFDRLRAGGVAVCAFNPLTPQGRTRTWSVNERDHRKLLVVDERVAFTGGINISRVYGSGSFSRGGRPAGRDPLEDGWRDTQIQLRGPVVQALEATFAEAWQEQQCSPAPAEARPVTTADEPGRRHVKVLVNRPAQPDNPIYRHLIAAVAAAREEVLLTMAYFAPGQEFVDALAAAARRGVKVRMVLPGRSDFQLVLQAGRSYYEDLLAAGVEIHEMQEAMLHAKTAVIDGVWSTVGSSNLDWRSLAMNHELNVVVVGEDFGGAMRALFEKDRRASSAITPQAWASRGIVQRLWESAGRLAERWL